MVTIRHLTSPPPEFDLVPLEVGLILHHFNKTLKKHNLVTDVTHRKLHQFHNNLTCYTHIVRAVSVTWKHWIGLTIARRTNRNGLH